MTESKIFVTGGAGFIGSHLVKRLLAQGECVTVYDNLSFGKKEFLSEFLENPNFTFIEKDLLDLDGLTQAMAGHSRVFHMAANSDIMRAMNEPGLDYKQGIEVTFHVLEAMRLNQVRELIYMSGSGVYGDYGALEITEKSFGLGPESMYGAAKLASEGMIGAYSHLYDIQAWIFRPANIIGTNATHGVIYDFIQKLKDDPSKLEVLGNGTQSKSYVHVDDFLNAVLFATDHAKDRMNIFNIANDSFVSVKEIAEKVISHMGLQDVEILYGDDSRGWKGDIPVCRLSTVKIRSLGWHAEYNTAQAVDKTIQELLEKK